MIYSSLLIPTKLIHSYWGGTLSNQDVAAALFYFTYLGSLIEWIPLFACSYFEFKVSMRRIRSFLTCKELDSGLVKNISSDYEFSASTKVETYNHTQVSEHSKYLLDSILSCPMSLLYPMKYQQHHH